MHFSSAGPGDLKNTPVGGAVLAGVFTAVTVFVFTVIFVPKLLIPSPVYTMLFLFGLAVIVAEYSIISHRLRLPFLLHMALFVILQWFGLWGRIWLVTGEIPPVFYPPFKTVAVHWEWFVTFTVLWLIILNFIGILARLSLIPESVKTSAVFARWSTELKIDLVPWERAWRSWRLTIFLTLMVTVLSVALGLTHLKTSKWLPIITTGLIIIQWVMGWVLISLGYFCLKRAFWKTDNLVPDHQFRTVWLSGVTPLLAGITVFGLVLPADFRAIDKWWLVSFADWFLKNFWKTPPDRPNPYSSLNRVAAGVTENTEPSLFIQIVQVIVMILTGLIVIAVPLIILTLLAVVIGYILSRTISNEVNRLKGLRGALIKIYLFWANLWRKRRRGRWPFFGRKEDGARADEVAALEKGQRHKAHLWGRGSQAIIRRGYYRLIGIARGQGFHWHPAQTPLDIASELTRMLPDEKISINEVTADYQLARYGLAEPPAEKIRLFERIRRTIQRRLQLYKNESGK